jgi:putative intracellular protease/amidase
VPWRILRDAGHEVVFATEREGTVPAADPRLLTGVLFGQLGAARAVKGLYEELAKAPEFSATLAWAELDPAGFDGLLLPGGHAPGMRQYLSSPALCERVGQFWPLGRPVGAICHGVLVLARTHDAATGRSVLAGCQTTCLPKYMERSAFLATAWRLGRSPRRSPCGTAATCPRAGRVTPTCSPGASARCSRVSSGAGGGRPPARSGAAGAAAPRHR